MNNQEAKTKEDLSASLATDGQEHLLGFWETLDDAQRESLAAEIRQLPFALVDRLFREVCRGEVPRDTGGEDRKQEDPRAMAMRASPAPAIRRNDPHRPFTPPEARARGIEALEAGQIGVILVAGGQGTRLGFDRPKGEFPIGPLSGHSLFQIHVEKIVAASKRYGKPIPLYLMTSPATHRATVDFFAKDRFGLPQQDLTIFCQGTMPAVDAVTGKVLLEKPHKIALSPDGHGGMLAAAKREGVLDDLQHRGIRHLFYLQVDNPLVEIASPEFIGYHLLARSEFSSQVVAKQAPRDRVGNVVEVDGRVRVIEYSDLPDEVAGRRAPDGSLVIWAGSIAVHVIDVAFLRRMADGRDELPFHVARKKVKFVDPGSPWARWLDGRRWIHRIKLGKRNAVKFERFIFDLMPEAENPLAVEVDAGRCFAPLKNAPGKGWLFGLLKRLGLAEDRDTPETVRAQMIALHTAWLREAGVKVDDGVPVEIRPGFASDAEELKGKIKPGRRISGPTTFPETE